MPWGKSYLGELRDGGRLGIDAHEFKHVQKLVHGDGIGTVDVDKLEDPANFPGAKK
jgi:hypothetical protein